MKIFVLGGAGKMGCIAVQALANDPRVTQVTIGDLNLEQAKTVAEYIGSSKISIQKVDLKDRQAFANILGESDVCLNATVYYTNLTVMETCIDAGVHYTDMGGLFHTTLKQLELHERFAETGISAVLGMGSAPGIPNVQARYAAERLDTIESIRIYDGIKSPPADDLRFTYAVPTILDELTQAPMVFRDGKFISCEPLSEFEDYIFTAPIGLLPMHLSLHSEVATLPITYAEKGLKECFFKINYWGMSKETVEKVRVLADFGFNQAEGIKIGDQEVAPRDVMIALLSGYVPPITDFLAATSNRPPNWVKEIVTEVHGTRDGEAITYRLGTLTCKGALPTGLAPAIAAIWLGEGRIQPGVHPPEKALAPEPFFDELAQHEIHTQVTITSML
ncbi:MAG: saccharopine dehydrogenase NADP-binding domain-containing protein [Anaerolineaceae bacterium]|nr:saccharopine dehydrogenase NADP-binding domain-containing protein [Anaerolineaceae bacterium]